MRAKAIMVCTFLLISAIGVGAATYQTLHSFTNFWPDDGNPFPGVIFDQYGNLYGVAAWGETNEGTIFQLTPSQGGWTFKNLHEFALDDTEGAGPIGGLVMDEAGNLYGTASYDHGEWMCGTVFKLSPSGSYWTFTVLHYFAGADGCDPESTLSYSNGVIWGATKGGGSTGQGTVFSMDTSGGSLQFDSFTGKNGSQPLSAFSLWGYGTTYSGGGKGQGNIYRLDPGKGLISKHSFKADGKAGYAPMGDLLTLYVGGVRTIYGTNSAGGVGGGGTVYRLTEIQPNSDKWRISVLHSFSGSDEGRAPMAGLTADSAGNLYGTTSSGGQDGRGCGTVFKLSPGKNNKWTHTVLYSFDATQSEGCWPTGGLVFDKAGNLYGTTQWGGDFLHGTVYEIIP
ncbi:MAG TPA: choice-of-anchor tandem repeat GloVer-containing protein [Terriglobales bacterium]